MLTALNKFLFILLAMLQLVAPLVHAHTAGEFYESGLHVPGLEQFTYSDDSTIARAINDGADGSHLIVDLDVGFIKAAQDNGEVQYYFLIQNGFPLSLSVLRYEINFSPQIHHIPIPSLFLAGLSPRAPPFPR